MNIKKVFPFLAAILITAFLCLTAFVFLLRPQALEIGTVDLNTVADGEYIGVCQNKILIAVVKVRIQNHEIIDIEVLEHKASYMGQAERIAGEVCDKQTLEVDAISGATFTSRTVLKAIENALK